MPKKQWLAKNELALARILPFVYTTFFNHVTLPQRLNVNCYVLPAIYKTIHTLHLLIWLLISPRGHTEREVDNTFTLFLSCVLDVWSGRNNVEDEAVSIEELQSMTKAHCLLLPYVLSNVVFPKQFAAVYDD